MDAYTVNVTRRELVVHPRTTLPTPLVTFTLSLGWNWADDAITTATHWREYAFKGKPGDITKRPPQVAPYHLRLDWLMWFVPFSVEVSEAGLATSGYELWFVRLLQKLLQGDAKTLALFASTPFGEKPPRYVRAVFYRYQFTTPAERQESHAWWKRKWLGEYMPPLDLRALRAAGLD